jgi:hypothetical protein
VAFVIDPINVGRSQGRRLDCAAPGKVSSTRNTRSVLHPHPRDRSVHLPVNGVVDKIEMLTGPYKAIVVHAISNPASYEGTVNVSMQTRSGGTTSIS